MSLLAAALTIGLVTGCTPTASSQVEFLHTATEPASDTARLTAEPRAMANSQQPSLESANHSVAGAAPPAGGPVVLVNPGFEVHDAGGRPAGWDHSGTLEAAYLEDRGHAGEVRLTHGSPAAYQVETRQVVTGLPNGWYTLRAWVRSSGGQKAVYLALRCGESERRVQVPPTTPGYRWMQLVVSNEVTDGQCSILLSSDGGPDTWASFDDVELVSGRAALTILGADISSLHKSEVKGGVYRDSDGTQGDALQILMRHGLNYARLRVFVEPADGYHGKEEILWMARRLQALGIRLLVDLHYSDNWADPGKQFKPAAWKDDDFEQLKSAVYDHTFEICQGLVAQGTPPDMVQVGNEINAGMLWPDGDYNHLDNLAALLKEGYRAVKDCSPSTLVMLHIAEGGDNDLARWWFDHMTRRQVPFDIIGISYYPFWHGSLMELQHNLNDITARYDRDVIVVETAYAFTDGEDDFLPNIANDSMVIPGYPFTPEGQRAMLRDVMAIVRAVPNGRGLGVFYWDATWTAVPGNGWDSTDPASGNAWENQALFNFDDQALPALDEFLDP